MALSGVYKIQSKIKPDRIYVGSAVNFEERWRLHLVQLRTNKHKNIKLQRHFNKYGEDDLTFSILAICNKDELTPIGKIIRPEQFFIWAYDPWFNICMIAGSVKGIKHSKEACEKNGLKHKGKHHSEEHKQKISQALMGHRFWGNKVAWNKGLTKETDDRVRANVEKTGETLKGRPPWNKGKKSDYMKGNIPWNKGKEGVYDEETLFKMREARKRYWANKKKEQSCQQ